MTDYNPSEHDWMRNREIELMRLETKTETEEGFYMNPIERLFDRLSEMKAWKLFLFVSLLPFAALGLLVVSIIGFAQTGTTGWAMDIALSFVVLIYSFVPVFQGLLYGFTYGWEWDDV